MKTKLTAGYTSLCILLYAATAMAGVGGESASPGLGVVIFLVFLAGIVFLQLIPGLILFGSLVVALFKRVPRKLAGPVGLASDDAGEDIL